ncbi:MAG: hypothetical protein ACJ73N_11830 [Bryobacteraceae bacterium]
MNNKFANSKILKHRTLNPARVLTGAVLLMALNGLATAETENSACSNHTIKGDYAFTISGETLNLTGTTSVTKGLALTTFDGSGKLRQMDFVVNDGVPSPGDGNSLTGFHFQGGETGTYTVNADCTGIAEIDLNVPVSYGSKGVIKLVFVLSDHGNTIHTVVAEFTPPGATMPVLGTTRSEGYKIKGDGRDHD